MVGLFFSEIIYHSDTFQHFSKSTFRFCPPEDGFPVCEDWVSTLESMMFGGVELQREPLDGGVSSRLGCFNKKSWVSWFTIPTLKPLVSILR
jgi:hypothetical protein